METVYCKCKKSKVTYDVVGLDLWSADLENCTKIVIKEIGEERYICNECKEIVDYNDFYMMAQ